MLKRFFRVAYKVALLVAAGLLVSGCPQLPPIVVPTPPPITLTPPPSPSPAPEPSPTIPPPSPTPSPEPSPAPTPPPSPSPIPTPSPEPSPSPVPIPSPTPYAPYDFSKIYPFNQGQRCLEGFQHRDGYPDLCFAVCPMPLDEGTECGTDRLLYNVQQHHRGFFTYKGQVFTAPYPAGIGDPPIVGDALARGVNPDTGEIIRGVDHAISCWPGSYRSGEDCVPYSIPSPKPSSSPTPSPIPSPAPSPVPPPIQACSAPPTDACLTVWGTSAGCNQFEDRGGLWKVNCDSTPKFKSSCGQGPCNGEHDNCCGMECEDQRGPVWTVDNADHWQVDDTNVFRVVFWAKEGSMVQITACPRKDVQDWNGFPMRVCAQGGDPCKSVVIKVGPKK